MIIYKPDWISHGDRTQGAKGKRPCIYSIHVHPDGKRLATGGLDTTIRIWNIEPILDEKAENDPNCHKLLCTMTMHNGAVLCVRWSNDGRYLASSSDNDNVIIIWELDREAGSGTVFGSSEVNHETWRAVNYLRGHASDVQDLAWSKDNQFLASCGVDGFVIVWDTTTFEQVKKIDDHGGFVKGITWDPVGKFLASQSDDKMLKIWRTSDWGLEADVKGPFINAPGTTLFRRLDWSPDGSYIAAANAVNGIQCVSTIINRNDWSTDISLVGHKMPIEVTAFSPKLFYVKEKPESEEDGNSQGETLATICALGGQDCSVSIWITKYCRPLCVASDLFDNNIYDLAWTPEGKTLFACSQDGTIACLRLDQELSHPALEEEAIAQLKQYGYGRQNATLPETPSQLDLEEDHAIAKAAASSNRISDLMGAPSEPTQNNVQATLLSQPPPPVSTAPTPQTTPASNPQASSTVLEQKETIGKNGKRRIQPIIVRSAQPSSTSSSKSMWNPQPQTAKQSPKWTQPLSESETVEYDIPGSGIGAQVQGTKQKTKNGSDAMDVDNESGLRATVTFLGERNRPTWIDAAVVPPVVSQSQVRLGVPKVKSTLLRKLPSDESSAVLECHNPPSLDNKTDYSKLVKSSKGSIMWTNYLSSAILLVAGNSSFSVAGCEDGSLHVYSSAGRRIIPPIVLESTPVHLHCTDQWLLCLTTTGLIYTWDIPNQKSCLSAVSIGPTLKIAQTTTSKSPTTAPSIKDARIYRNGIPLVITSHHQAFAFHLSMNVWLRVSDAWYVLSEFWDTYTRPGASRLDKHPLGWLSVAVNTANGIDPANQTLESLANANKDIGNSITISHIESQLAVAALLDSPQEYEEWLMRYARRLAKENEQGKVVELCRWLMGPPFVPVEYGAWEPNILSTLSKHTLLERILPVLGQNRSFQRLVAEYKDALCLV